jgi:hypothetical protein
LTNYKIFGKQSEKLTPANSLYIFEKLTSFRFNRIASDYPQRGISERILTDKPVILN